MDLSESGDVAEAMKNYYAFLRDAELVIDAKTILIVGKQDFKINVKRNGEFFPALYDKMFRSASGVCVKLMGNGVRKLKFYK